VLNTLEEAFGPAIQDYWRKYEPTGLTVQWFMRILKDIDLDSSPGWPWKSHGFTTNRELLMNADGTVNRDNVILVFEAVRDRYAELQEKAVADDVNVFIKDELHKTSKRQKKAWRLISSVSLTDCIIDRYLFGEFFNQLYTKEGYTKTPNKAGWSPVKGGYQWFYRRFRGKKVLMADKSCWDWTVQSWLVDILTSLMLRICGHDEKLTNIIRNRIKAVFRSTFNVGGYARFEQLLDGIMKSGCLGTIAWNGICQVACDILAKLRAHMETGDLPDVMGDDTIQELMDRLDEYLNMLTTTGCLVKEYMVSDTREGESLEFAGTTFDAIKSVPTYREKHLAALMTLADSPEHKREMLTSYQRLYAHDDFMFPRLTKWLLSLEGAAVSRAYARDWYDGRVEDSADFKFEL